jgi:histone deacetylase complex regulatory component SIN3
MMDVNRQQEDHGFDEDEARHGTDNYISDSDDEMDMDFEDSNVQQEHQRDTAILLGFQDCIIYIAKVKKELLASRQDEVYNDFVEVLSTWMHRKLAWDEVYGEILNVLKDHPDLLEEFPKFLPEHVQQKSMISCRS